MKRSTTIIVVVMLGTVIAGSALTYWYWQQPQKQVLILTTTTSTFDTGLLDYLTPIFQKEYNVVMKILSKGTGESIEIAKRGDADVVLVHTRTLEEDFVNQGYGVHRVGVMYNDFIIIGPKEDPAGISGTTNASYAFQKIFEAGARGAATFISRSDKSGTHNKELSIWTRIGVKPSNKSFTWYLEAGAGMGTVLRMTNEKRAYTLTDRATWLAFKDQLTKLAVLTQYDAFLLNPYAVIPVNHERLPQRNYRMAVAFAKFLVSEEGQELIAKFEKGGETLFVPVARNYTKAHELGFPNQEQEIAWYDSVNPVNLTFEAPVVVQEEASENTFFRLIESGQFDRTEGPIGSYS